MTGGWVRALIYCVACTYNTSVSFPDFLTPCVTVSAKAGCVCIRYHQWLHWALGYNGCWRNNTHQSTRRCRSCKLHHRFDIFSPSRASNQGQDKSNYKNSLLSLPTDATEPQRSWNIRNFTQIIAKNLTAFLIS